MFPTMPLKLGLHPPKDDPRTLQLGDYLSVSRLPSPPPSVDWGKVVKEWPLFGNDRIGICGPAAAAHLEEAWSANVNGFPVEISDQEVLTEYEALSGYSPDTGEHDDGVVLLNLLKRWRNAGLFGRKIAAFVRVNPRNVDHVRIAHWLFGGLLVGAALPLLAEEQFRAKECWAVPAFAWGRSAPGSWGGHAISISACDQDGLTCETWGTTQRMSWGWAQTYWTECYAVLSRDWLNAAGKAPSGFSLDLLGYDLGLL